MCKKYTNLVATCLLNYIKINKAFVGIRLCPGSATLLALIGTQHCGLAQHGLPMAQSVVTTEKYHRPAQHGLSWH